MKLKTKIVTTLKKCLNDSKHEICAFLLENKSNDQKIIRVRNFSGNPYGFTLPNSELIRIQEHANTTGFKIIAFIHSHFTSLKLSEQDHDSFQYSLYPWIIVKMGKSGLLSKLYKL